jgi:hypothetical protein
MATLLDGGMRLALRGRCPSCEAAMSAVRVNRSVRPKYVAEEQFELSKRPECISLLPYS